MQLDKQATLTSYVLLVIGRIIFLGLLATQQQDSSKATVTAQ
jgi:hypothetical protein